MKLELEKNEQLRSDAFQQASVALSREIDGGGTMPALVPIIIVNLLILFCRPQHEVPLLAKVLIPIILSLIPVPWVLFRSVELWRSQAQIKAMFGFLVLGAAWVPLALNNFLAYNAFRDVLAQHVCYFYPALLFMHTGKQIRKLAATIVAIGLYLSAYGILHHGTGPGAWLGDENDLCVCLLALLGIPLVFAPQAKTFFGKAANLGAALGLLATIVISSSRGGFIGLVCLLGYTYVKSQAKVGMAAVGVVLILVGVAFVPQKYWDEMSTIKQTNSGTADQRRQTWDIAMSIWKDPKRNVFGTGFNNAPIYLGIYEPKINQSKYKKSFAGRALHSSFFQLLVDTGTVGLLLFATMVWASIIGGNKLIKRLKKGQREAQSAIAALRQSAEERTGRMSDEEEDSISGTVRLLQKSAEEMNYSITLLTAMSASWCGAMGAGFFVSALYYPSYWMLGGVTATAHYHARRVLSFSEPLTDAITGGSAASGEEEQDGKAVG